MRVAMYYNNQDLRLQELPQPAIGPGELLVRVEAASICGSDVMEWYRRGQTPLVLGHEISGVIAEIGEGIVKFRRGQRVVCAHHLPCGQCHYCQNGHEAVCATLRKTNFDPGGFAQYLRLSRLHTDSGVFILSENVSFEEGTFVEPLACCLRGQRLAGMKPQKAVLVIGSGIAGLLHIQLAKLKGANVVLATDIHPFRLAAAQNFGVDKAILAQNYSPRIFAALNDNRLADLVITTSGQPLAIQQALDSVEPGGTVLFFAPTPEEKEIPLSFNRLFWRNEITLTSSYAANPAEYQEALDLIASGRLKVKEMITHRLSFAEIGLGFKLVAEAAESIKVIIYPQR